MRTLVGVKVDHLVVGAADLDTGIAWVEERLGVAPVPGGVHGGFGTRNALLALGPDQYLEVLALDPAQDGRLGDLAETVALMDEPRVYTVAVASTDLADPVPMARTRPDGVELRWALSFTRTPLFFIDWMGSPHPASSGLPDGGTITKVTITTPEPDSLAGVEDVTVREGSWRVEAEIDGRRLA
jgi:hypothetical protein